MDQCACTPFQRREIKRFVIQRAQRRRNHGFFNFMKIDNFSGLSVVIF